MDDSGQFKNAWRAQMLSTIILGEETDYIIKSYNDAAKDHFESTVQESLKDSMRKNVQYHIMVRHILLGLEKEAPAEYGTHFTMHKAYFGTCIDTKEVYIVEPFLNGTFTKTVNNNGCI